MVVQYAVLFRGYRSVKLEQEFGPSGDQSTPAFQGVGTDRWFIVANLGITIQNSFIRRLSAEKARNVFRKETYAPLQTGKVHSDLYCSSF